MVLLNVNEDLGGLLKDNDIISAILHSDKDALIAALDNDPHCVNSIHEESQMNAPMLAAFGNLPSYLDEMLVYGHLIDFKYATPDGNDLLDAALMSLNQSVINKVKGAYEKFAPQILNNWPEP